MNDHGRDIFLWRWARDSVGGPAPAVIWGALFGGLAGLFLSWAHATTGTQLPFAFLALTVLAAPAVDYIPWRPVRMLLHVAGWAVLLALVLKAPDFTASVRTIIYVAIGLVLGAGAAWRNFKANERLFSKLRAEGFAIPQQRPMPGWQDAKTPAIIVLLVVLGFGPTLVLGLFVPH